MRPLLLISILLAAGPSGPRPPCRGAGTLAYPGLGKPPITSVWSGRDRSWAPPACTEWQAPGYTTLVETYGTVRLPGGDEGLLRRIGAISSLSGVRYWSTTHGRWQTLVVRAAARTGSSTEVERGDFSLRELTAGMDLFFEQEDNLTGSAVYRLRVLEAGADRVVFATENAGTIHYWLKTLFHPGDLQSVHFFEREGPDVWRYHGLSRTGQGASRLAASHPASAVNRAVAFYRHYAGIPTDQEPPAAR